jgi:hypothetical protein
MSNQVAFADNSALARNKQPKLRITPRVKAAIEAMVNNGLELDAAAREAGITTRALRLAFEKPHITAFYRSQLLVLRASRSAKNFHRLCEIADDENNMPAVNAIKVLEQLSDEQTNKPTQASPGITINIVSGAAPVQHDPKLIEQKADEC